MTRSSEQNTMMAGVMAIGATLKVLLVKFLGLPGSLLGSLAMVGSREVVSAYTKEQLDQLSKTSQQPPIVQKTHTTIEPQLNISVSILFYNRF